MTSYIDDVAITPISQFIPLISSGVLAFSSTTYSLNEDGTAITEVTVNRTGGSNGAVSATINFQDGTAKAPSDYNNTPITVNFADGETTKTVNFSQVSQGLSFDGINDRVDNNKVIPNLTDTFTIEFWANPTATRNLTNESNSNNNYSGIGGQRYAIFPIHGENVVGSGHAGAGVSVGTNGISVFEHSSHYIPSLLVFESLLSGWNHIAIVYNNKTPSLYLNGQFIKTGLKSNYIIHPSFQLGTPSDYGAYQGQLDEVRIWNKARTQAEIQANLNRELMGNESGLVGYWNFNSVKGNTVDDLTSNQNDGTIIEAQTTAGFGAISGTIPIINDTTPELDETLQLTLTNPTNGATIGTQNTATLTIVDNDLPNIGKWTTVTNGEFETGDLNGWSHISTNTSWGNLWTITSDRSISGNFSAKAVTNTGFNGNGYALQRTVTGLIAGEKYVLSGFIYTGELTSGNTYLDLNDIDNDLDIGAGYGIDQWQFVWKEFVAPSNQVTVRLVRDGEEVKAGESAYIDDVAITPISQFIPLISSDAPTLAQAIADQNAKQGNVFNFQIPTNTFTDIDAGDVLTYSATLENGNALPSWLTFNPSTQTFSGTPTNDHVGNLNVKVIATDKAGETVSDIFTITVENVNDAPILKNSLLDQTVKVNSTFTFTLPKNTFSDPDAVNPYKNLVIFGDSLSDTGNAYQASGNTFPPPPNYQGRLSNGLIWVDYLAPDLQFTDQSIENFAFLGANTGVSNTFGQITVPGLLTQIQQFKTLNTATPIGKDGLYVIWAGANDFLNPATDPTQAVTNAVTNISSAIATLAELGAKEIVVGNLTDLGATPFSIANNNVANARLISIGFNAALNQALTNLEPVLNVDLSLVDIFGLSTAFQTNPASYNFTNITQPLITVTNPVNPDQYAFWDDVHPTTKLHQLVTDTFVNTLLNDGVIPDLIKYSATLADGSNLPDWLNFNSTTRTFTGTPKTANIGQLNVKVIATDKAGANVSDIFTFYLENVNNAPTNITINNSTVAENQAIGTVIGNLSTTDPDTANTFTYSLVTGTGATDNSLFTITNNQLKTNSVFDYETKNSYSIRVKTTDQDGLSYEKELTININDLNEITGNTLINNGRNPIVGTAGSDYITGGPGAKTITGGAGSDSFVFTNLRDVGQRITDFTLGEDKIVLSQLFSSISYTGTNPIADQYIQFVAGIGSNANSTFLQIDRDGSLGSAIFKNFLQLDNITTTQLNNINNFVF